MTDPIYVDWLRNLKRVLSSIRFLFFLGMGSPRRRQAERVPREYRTLWVASGKNASRQMIYFYYGKLGHRNRNCKVYLAGVKLGVLDVSKGMYEIHTILDSSTSYTWILDTTCGHHICKSLQGIQRLRVLKEGDFELYKCWRSIPSSRGRRDL